MPAVRPQVARLQGYVPGEQPREGGWTKLNTNENPYPTSPRVAEAIAAATSRLQIYPDPMGTAFRQAAAEVLDVDPEWILPANGSDESLTILMRTFVDPGETVAYPYPSYILYETLADLQGANHVRLPLNSDWSWNLAAATEVASRSKLVIVPNPNSPSGNLWDDETLLQLVPRDGILVIDEAYRDFAEEPRRLRQLLDQPAGRRVIVTRTLSKSYSLAGLRFGFAVANPEFIEEMRKVKDSYNCDTLSLAAAEAALLDQAWMLENTRRIHATRTRLDARLHDLGFETIPSHANFVWATHATGRHRDIYEQLKARKVLVRWMRFPNAFGVSDGTIYDGLRMTVGTDSQVDHLLAELEPIVKSL